jgi:phosphoribosylformylglycinamidine synthase subunit PurSL
LDLNLDHLPADRELDDLTACFAETPSRYLLEVRPENLGIVVSLFKQAGVPLGQVGLFAGHDRLTVRCGRHGRIVDQALETLRKSWIEPLDW